jgi:glycosyltransferase involved in cell wall biosynthesis
MGTDSGKLRIAYAGTLAWFDPEIHPVPRYSWKGWFLGFKALNVDFTTRSAWFLFCGLKELIKRDPSWQDRIEIDFWGLIDQGNLSQAKKLGIEKMVHISGYLPKAESLEKLSRADLMFLPLETGREGHRPLYIPGKLFELLKLGKPILALAEPSDCREILEKSGLGCIAPPRDASAIADAIEKIYHLKNELSRHYRPDASYIESFSFVHKTEELSKVFDQVLGKV